MISFALAIGIWFGMGLLTENLRWIKWAALVPLFLGGLTAPASIIIEAKRLSEQE